jgi:hypothetical protein
LTVSTDEATGYNVYNNEVLVNDTAITDTNYAVAGLASTEYSFTVKAIGNNGDSSASTKNYNNQSSTACRSTSKQIQHHHQQY